MSKLKRFRLSFDPTLYYFQDNLTNTNILSNEVINLINFGSGAFYTLLPQTVDIKLIHEFSRGHIAQGVRDQIGAFVLNKLFLHEESVCFFDDSTAVYNETFLDPLFKSNGIHLGEEVYYIVNQLTASLHLIKRCLSASNAIWHSLCVLSAFDCQNIKNREFTLANIQEICLGAKIIILGAYDEEGYVIWEKSALPTPSEL